MQPKPLHQPVRKPSGFFLGTVKNTDYYMHNDLDKIVRVRSTPGHIVTPETGVSVAILQLLSWGESDMANRIRAAIAMSKGT